MRRKFIGVICCALCAAAILCGCGAEVKAPEQENLPVLTIGSDEYEPFIYISDSKTYEGIDVDIAGEACRRIGYRAEFKIIRWDDKDTYIENGDVDCLWGSFSMDGREDAYQWAGPYMTSKQCVLVRTDSDIYTLNDLNGKKVAVQATTKPEKIFLDYANPNVPKVGNVYSFVETEEEFAALRKGYVDACAGHKFRLENYIKTAQLKCRILDEVLMTSNLGVAFSKDFDSNVVQKLNAALNDMKNEGTIDEIVRKYE